MSEKLTKEEQIAEDKRGNGAVALVFAATLVFVIACLCVSGFIAISGNAL